MRASTLLLVTAASLLAPAHAQAPAAAEPASFEAIELRGGGRVTVRHGPVHQVRIVSGNSGREIRSDGDRLVIERCRGECPGGHRIEVEIVTPQISEVAVTDGGLIQLVGDFPSQPALAASVSDGGTIDVRPLEAASISAAVSQGGRILANPGRTMAVAISDGGNVTYWGSASVTSSVRRGGVVVRGAAEDLRAPLAQFNPPLLAPPTPPKPLRNH